MHFHANQRYTCAICANHDAHGSRVTFHVYMYAQLLHHVHTQNIFTSIFKNVSSHAVAACVHSQGRVGKERYIVIPTYHVVFDLINVLIITFITVY